MGDLRASPGHAFRDPSGGSVNFFLFLTSLGGELGASPTQIIHHSCKGVSSGGQGTELVRYFSEPSEFSAIGQRLLDRSISNLDCSPGTRGRYTQPMDKPRTYLAPQEHNLWVL